MYVYECIYVLCMYISLFIYLFGASTLTAFMYRMWEEWRDMYEVLVFMSDFIEVSCVALFMKENRNICYSGIEY